MGDRANIFVKEGDEHGVYLYTHWQGSDLPGILRDALRRGRDRWDDAQYLARIIFCEMVQEDVLGLTGFGITSRVWDGDDRIIVVEPERCGRPGTVTMKGKSWTLEEFCGPGGKLE